MLTVTARTSGSTVSPWKTPCGVESIIRVAVAVERRGNSALTITRNRSR
jgi:hypothetical protein